MSDYNIQIISNLLLGITNTNKNIRTNSINKIQDFYQNHFDLFFYSLLNIIENTFNAKDDISILLKNTSLVIGRKVLEIIDYEEWDKITIDMKMKIKNKLLFILKNEINCDGDHKAFDIIIVLFSKIFENEEIWPELSDILLSIFNLDPQKEENNLQIYAILYIIKGGLNFLYKKISNILDKLILYLKLIFNSSNISFKSKILAGELIYEIASLSSTHELEIIQILIKNIVILLYNCYEEYEINKKNEQDIKSILQILINIESLEPNLLKIYFTDIFNICNIIISQNLFKDQKIRELGFELLVSYIESFPNIIESSNNSTEIIYSILALSLNYSFEFEENLEANTSINFIYESEEYFIEEKINFIILLLERLFDCFKSSFYEKAFKLFINNNFNKSWKHQYIILFMIITYSKFSNDINFFQHFFECFPELLNSNENKIKFSTLYCIKNFLIKYKNDFLEKNMMHIFPLIINLIKNEIDIKCKYEVLICLKYIIRYNKNESFYDYIDDLINLLMNNFIERNTSCYIRKLILSNILEINSKRNNSKINLALKKIDINAFMKYFINLFDKKIDCNLYCNLLKVIVFLGSNNTELFNKIFPELMNYIIKLFSLIESMNKMNKQVLSIKELENSFKKIFPIISKNNLYKEYLDELILKIISLIRSEKKIYLESSKINIDKNRNFFNIEDNLNINFQSEYKLENGELYYLLSILDLILNSIDKLDNQKNLFLIENEILSLIEHFLDKKSRKKIAMILSRIIFLYTDKKQKSLIFINILLDTIKHEIEAENVKSYFEQLKEIINLNDSQFLNKNQINQLYNKCYDFNNNLKIKREQLIEKLNIRYKNKNFEINHLNDENYIDNSIEEEIEIIEDIQMEIVDIFGILLKTHKDKCNNIIEQIIQKFIPFLINSKEDLYIKLALSSCDDLIEYLGQEYLIESIWDSLYEILIEYINNENFPIIQISAYGIGIFTQNTKNNFEKYAKLLIYNIFQSLSYLINKKKVINEDNEDFFLALDNVVAALGKIISYQYDNQIVQENLNELIQNWILNLPIKLDESECENQHEWMVNLFLNKKELIPLNCYSHYFQSLADIYETKLSNDSIDKNIEIIFSQHIKKDEKLLNILSIIYENSSSDIKSKLQILAKKN